MLCYDCPNCKKIISKREIWCKYRGKTHPRAKKCNKRGVENVTNTSGMR